jgi:hypothetical protein
MAPGAPRGAAGVPRSGVGKCLQQYEFIVANY